MPLSDKMLGEWFLTALFNNTQPLLNQLLHFSLPSIILVGILLILVDLRKQTFASTG